MIALPTRPQQVGTCAVRKKRSTAEAVPTWKLWLGSNDVCALGNRSSIEASRTLLPQRVVDMARRRSVSFEALDERLPLNESPPLRGLNISWGRIANYYTAGTNQ